MSRVARPAGAPAVAHDLDTASADRIAELPGVTERVLSENSVGQSIRTIALSYWKAGRRGSDLRAAESAEVGSELVAINAQTQRKPANTRYQKTRPANKIENCAESAKAGIAKVADQLN